MPDPLGRPMEPGHPRLQLVPPLASANPAVPGADVRYQVRPVVWGDRSRFQVRDTLTDTTLATRATRRDAEDEVIVLNIVGPGALGYRSAPEPSSPAPVLDMARRLHPARTSAGTEGTVQARV